MTWRREVMAIRLQRVGVVALLGFVVLYTIFILVFSTWQERSVPAAWLANLPEALFAFPLAALFWAGVAAWLSGSTPLEMSGVQLIPRSSGPDDRAAADERPSGAGRPRPPVRSKNQRLARRRVSRSAARLPEV